MKLLEPVLLSTIAPLQIQARLVVDGVLAGLHTSRLRGHSLEYAQHREYVTGDDLRYIDWKMHGRSDRYFVKQYQDETNLRCCILLDASASMAFSTGAVTKLAYASVAAAALSYMLIHQGDAAGIGIFDETLRTFLPPMHQQSYLPLILSAIEKTVPGGDTGIHTALRSAAGQLKKRSMVIVISDLMGDQDQIISALKHMSCRHYEVLVLQVLDKCELDLDLTGELSFEPMEHGVAVKADADDIRVEYRNIVRAVQHAYTAAFRAARIDHAVVRTDEPIAHGLVRLLAKRMAR